MLPVGHNGPMTTPTDPARYAGADLRLAAVDMDGTLLDDDKNFPPGMDELLDQMDARGGTFAPASGRQVWTLIDMFPGRPGMTVIGESGGIVMRDGVEVSSSPLDAPTMREAVRLVREATSGPDGIDGGLDMCGKQFAYVERTDDRFVDGVLPYYHRTKRVDDQIAIIDAIEAGEIDDAIVKLAVYVIGPVQALAEAPWPTSPIPTSTRFPAQTGRICRFEASTRGALCATCSASSVLTALRPPSLATPVTTCR